MATVGSGSGGDTSQEAGAQQPEQTPLVVVSLTGAGGDESGMQSALQSFKSPSNTGQDPIPASSQVQDISIADQPHTVSDTGRSHSPRPGSPEGGLLHPGHAEPRQEASSGPDFNKLIDNFNGALKVACEAGEALQECCEKMSKNPDSASFESGADVKYCQEELDEYQMSCSKLIQYEQHLKEAYQEEYKDLEHRLQQIHDAEMKQVQRGHSEEVKELKGEIQLLSEHQVLLRLQHSSAEVAEIDKLRNSYREKEEEVKTLRSTLAEKEKSLHELGNKIRSMVTELERCSLVSDKDYMQEQLQRCEQIGQMVSRLPNITSNKERNELVEEIRKNTAEMKSSNKRSISWRC